MEVRSIPTYHKGSEVEEGTRGKKMGQKTRSRGEYEKGRKTVEKHMYILKDHFKRRNIRELKKKKIMAVTGQRQRTSSRKELKGQEDGKNPKGHERGKKLKPRGKPLEKQGSRRKGGEYWSKKDLKQEEEEVPRKKKGGVKNTDSNAD